MPGTTTNYGWQKPLGADAANTIDDTVSSALDAIDTQVKTIADLANLEPTPLGNMTGTVTVDCAGAEVLLCTGTISADTHLATTGYLTSPDRFTIIQFELTMGSPGGHLLVFDDTITWAGGNYPPVIPTTAGAALRFQLSSSDGGVTKNGLCPQPVRTHTLRMGTGADNTDVLDLEYFRYDARIVNVQPSCAPPVSTAAVMDLLKGSGDGTASSIYTTTANRPSVAATKRTNTGTVLPDTVLIAPGDYLRGKWITASSATNGALAVTTIEAAV